MNWKDIAEIFNSIIQGMGSWYPTSLNVYSIIGNVVKYMLIYQTFYLIIGTFFTRKFKPAKVQHKYAVCIAARNEEAVIGNLLDSIAKQDYPAELLKVFVIADNCDDKTAQIARSKGAVCYERFDKEHRTKGYALQFLFERIEEDYGRQSFEGYFIFDADNLLKNDYISRMNDSFDAGEKIITSFRNTKNFDENWVASTYALHWIRSARQNHRTRSLLRLATNIQGTGFLFASELVRNGWNYTSLTEDRAFTADAVVQGYSISYNDAAEFYDEQPTSLKIAMRQRIRWAKGHLMAFCESGWGLFTNIFYDRTRSKSFVDQIRHRFASYDTLVQLTPKPLFRLLRWFIVKVILYACYQNAWVALLWPIWWRISYRIGAYLTNIWMAPYLFIVEYKRIKKMPLLKKVLFTFTWPIFDIIGRYSMYIALFVKVTWKPIPHTSKLNIDDVDAAINGAEEEDCSDQTKHKKRNAHDPEKIYYK